MDQAFDVIIVGGGMVGASMACALDGAGLAVAVIETQVPDSAAQPSFDERTIALTWSSRQIFAGLGLWDAIRDEASPICDIEVTDRGHVGHCRLSHRDAGTPALGYVLPSRVIGQALHARAEAADDVALICPARVTNVRCHSDRVDVQIELSEPADAEADAEARATRTVTTRLLIIADGGRSPIGEQVGLRASRKGYRQSALVTTVRSDRPHAGMAYERFVGSGPLAMLPLDDSAFAVVWTLEPDAVDEYREMSDDRLLAQLQQVFGDRAGRFTDLGTRAFHPLSVARVARPTAPRVVAIGNAAHLVHPVAGQGFNLGLKDVADLAEQVREMHLGGADIADAAALRRYARQRRRETRNVLNFTDSMIGLFSSDFPPLVLGRNLGLMAIEKLPFIKRHLLRRTMGLNGRQSKLVSGLPLRRARAAAAAREETDIVIVGAGLIGGALAALLGDTRYRVVILDRVPPPAPPTGDFGLRINAYNRAAERILEDCDVWRRLPADRIFPFRHAFVGNAGGAGAVSFSAADIGETHLGHFIENDLVTAILIDRVREFANVDVRTDVEIRDISFEPERAVVHTSVGTDFAARLLVGGDGGESRVRAAAGIGVSRHPYGQRCIVATIAFDGDLDATAWQRFLPTGPVGLLPLAPGYCSLAWSCDEAYAERVLDMSEGEFRAELDAAIQGRLGTITRVGPRASFPLIARDAATYVADRTALVGDAAHVIHPLAGLGANIGFQDVWALSRLLLEVEPVSSADIGAPRLLRRYERRRHRENRLVMSTMSAFNAVFSNDTAVLARFRNRALDVANTIKPAKRFLMRRAMWMNWGPAPNPLPTNVGRDGPNG